MAENVENLSGEDRIAALKAKMQASAQKVKAAAAEADAEGAQEPPAVADSATEAVVDAPETAVPETAAQEPVAEATQADVVEAAAVEGAAGEMVEDASEEVAEEANGATTNGISAPASVVPPPVLQGKPEEDPEAAMQRQYSRREFLTYAWGAATGLVLAESGLGIYLFMYPRFRAGEFGGKFFVNAAEWPVHDNAPVGNPDGKFWLVETEDGARKAIYMVCTHLGCLYKWEPANWRFECPCHGSKFSHDGFYIEGPAPRSLDYFELTDEGDEVAVDTGAKITGTPASESPARHIVV